MTRAPASQATAGSSEPALARGRVRRVQVGPPLHVKRTATLRDAKTTRLTRSRQPKFLLALEAHKYHRNIKQRSIC
jgi:hypothetical protein